jgi:PPP family 3-phenylpropionic acid transporter
MGVLAPPIAGVLADVLGLRGLLLRAACFGSCFAFVLLYVAGLTQRRLSFGEMLAIVLLFAAFRAPMMTLADVVAAEGESSMRAYGRTRVWGSLGFLAASFGVGHYLDPMSPTALPIAIAAPLLVAFMTAFAIPPRRAGVRSKGAGEIRALLACRDLAALIGIAFVAELAISCQELCLPLYLSELGASMGLIGAVWGGGVACEIVAMLSTVRLLARVRPLSLLAMALFLCAARSALIASTRSLSALLAIALLHAPSLALLWTSALAALRQSQRNETFASAQGILAAATAAGAVVGMPAWGALFHRSGRLAFAVAACVATAAAIVALCWLARARRGPVMAPADAPRVGRDPQP